MSAATAAGYRSLLGLDAAAYTPHAVHGPSRTYQESNCYTDIVIELLHARGDEPLAALGSLLRMDFEGDQWSFFKPFGEDLERLFGIDVHEMQPYRPLPEQIAEQIDAGRTIAVELDSWFLPDTHATSYRREHVKSSIIAESIDLDRCWLRYFHGPGLFELEGEDFAGVFRTAGSAAEVLPPYTELVRFDAGPRLSGEELREASRRSLLGHLAHRPTSDPFERFALQLDRELPNLLAGDAEDYHAYAFATVRMVGAAFELAAAQLDWLLAEDGAPASEPMREIVEGSKVLSFRLARRRSFDAAPLMSSLSNAWNAAMSALEGVLA